MVFDHLLRLTGPYGVYEHADRTEPRLEHGYCVDDNARVLVVLARFERPEETAETYRRSLRLVLDGRTGSGWRNRLATDGVWLDDLGPEDSHGRALWGLGVHLRDRFDDEEAAEALRAGFDRHLSYPRALAFGVLGAVEVLDHPVVGGVAGGFLERAVIALPQPRPGGWRWPEDRLTYANARLPEAFIAAGTALDIARSVDEGCDLLEWLVQVELGADRFSFTPVGGRGPGGRGPGFDQQPIEAWSMLDACRRAGGASDDSRWDGYARLAREWFFGRNDGGIPLYDDETGGGCDGLTPTGRNENRGAESTLAGLAAVADTLEYP